MRMIELPRPQAVPPPDLLRQIVVPPTPDPQSRLVLTIALLAVEDPTLLGPEDVQMLGKAMLENLLGEAAF